MRVAPHLPPGVRALAPVRGVVASAAIALLVAACADPRTPLERDATRLAGRPQARRLTCESRSAADLLAFHGVTGGEADVFGRIPRSDDPDLGFVGDPDGEPGGIPPAPYGVHAPPVAAALVALGLDARAEAGRDYGWLVSETRAGRPVIAWVTASCDPSARTRLVSRTGRSFVAVRKEHTMLVLAAHGAGVVVLDPANGLVRRFEREPFERAFDLLGGTAVSATGAIAPPRAARSSADGG